MKFFEHVKYLGMYWGEPSLQPLIDALGITKAPKLPKGDTDAYVEIKKSGLFLIFSDERTVNIPGKVFPEGALVLTNLTFYLTDKDGYSSYKGAVPSGVSQNATRADVLKAMGFPSSPKYSPDGVLLPDENDRMMRWDKAGHFVFCAFASDGKASRTGLQLPLDQA
jgi:hypothetical protein